MITLLSARPLRYDVNVRVRMPRPVGEPVLSDNAFYPGPVAP